MDRSQRQSQDMGLFRCRMRSVNRKVSTKMNGSRRILLLMQVRLYRIHLEVFSAHRIAPSRASAQIPYITHGTLRDMILFGLPYMPSRYETVVQQCGLASDFAMFTNGDQEEIGANGVTLSGGQRARLSLAVSIRVQL
jgi:ABC-type transport system involved in cytochrome bd biosynthesis fused ATPase/permease subunit